MRYSDKNEEWLNPFLIFYTKIFENDPFAKLDQTGVGIKSKRNLVCHAIGLDYVSCSPFRVPIARLAAAQVGHRRNKLYMV